MGLRFRQIHLDFHTSPLIPGVGSEFDPDAFAATMADAAVDSVTVFARCHHGMIYYDTKFKEARHPSLTRNLLGEQIEALHKRGIRAPIYITVGWDEFMAERHPEFIEVDAEGRRQGAPPLKPGWRKLCLNSPYIDYVFDVTREVLENFEVDGLFFDIIHQRDCCCPRCLAGMRKAGLDPNDPGQRKAWSRRVVEEYCRRQTEFVRQYNKECTIFYNSGHVGPGMRSRLAAFTHLELESLPTGGWGYDHFPLTARYARNLGYEFLGMTGKFQKSWADFGGFKPQAALEYDCFAALAYGGRCSIGDQLHPTGRLDPATYDLIKPVYRSVAAKEPWCEGARAVTEIAIVTPEALGLEDGRVDSSARGALRLLQEAHHQFDVVDFDMPWDRYKLVILPDKIVLDGENRKKVQDFIRGGGKVLASHRSGLAPDGSGFVLPELGVRLLGELEYSPDYIEALGPLADGVRPTQHVMYDRGLKVAIERGEALARIWKPYFNRTWEHFTSHAHAPAERPTEDPGVVRADSCIYFAHPAFASYGAHGAEALRRMLLNAVSLLLGDPLVRTNAPSTAQVTVMRQEGAGGTGGRTVVHLLHYIPEARYSKLNLVVERLPLFDVSVELRLERRPDRAYLAPERTPLAFEYSDGTVKVTVPRVDGHAMVVLE